LAARLSSPPPLRWAPKSTTLIYLIPHNRSAARSGRAGWRWR
jgi:hypothetical protein